eukprot:jgi/Mesvir1/16365/Mv18113-RA.1
MLTLWDGLLENGAQRGKALRVSLDVQRAQWSGKFSGITTHFRSKKPPKGGPPPLWKLVGVDVCAATVAAFAVSPFITTLDKSIVAYSSGASTMRAALLDGARTFLSNPVKFCSTPEFAWVYGLTAATYMTANIMDTVTKHHRMRGADMVKLLGTTAVNMPLCILKDKAFARRFGLVASASFPPLSYGLFAARDLASIAASFTLPPKLSLYLQDRWQLPASRADIMAQLLCPAAMQLGSTPLHLCGLDLYNQPNASWVTRCASIYRQYGTSVLVRIGRFGPAIGIGGFSNTSLRKAGRAYCERKPAAGEDAQALKEA